jgi:diguanylate cyclase (GGDEF)-like protein
MKKHSLHFRLINKLSLRNIILVPVFLIVIIGSVFSYFQINRFVTDHSKKLIASNQMRIKNHIVDHLNDYFESAEEINRLNALLVDHGQLSLDDEEALGRVLLGEVHSNKSVDYAYYANKKGGIVSSGIHNGVDRISYTEGLVKGSFDIYELDDNGRLTYIKSAEDFDPRSRSWYTEAIRNQSSYWTEVYSGAQEPILGMSTSLPVMDSSGQVIGVFGTDMLLTQLSMFLNTMDLSENSVICLVDEYGLIVASSTNEKPFKNDGDVQERLAASESSHSVIQAGFLQESLVDGNLKVDGDTYYYSFAPYSFKNKVNWTVMVAIPRQDLIGDIEILFQRFNTGFLIIIILMLISYFKISKWIVEPVIFLNDKVEEMTNNNWGVQIKTERNDELGQLTNSFNKMSFKLKEYLSMLDSKQKELEHVNSSLESIVKERTKELELLSITDGLTEIYNKRYLMDALDTSIEDAQKFDMPFSIILFDLDFFKSVNDTYGHMEGDVTLKAVSSFLSRKIYKTDIFGRYGGEEFMIIMPNKRLDEAYRLADSYREEISNLLIGTQEIKLTVSGGVAAYQIGDTAKELIERADKNLYEAKDSGRNKVIK